MVLLQDISMESGEAGQLGNRRDQENDKQSDTNDTHGAEVVAEVAQSRISCFETVVKRTPLSECTQ